MAERIRDGRVKLQDKLRQRKRRAQDTTPRTRQSARASVGLEPAARRGHRFPTDAVAEETYQQWAANRSIEYQDDPLAFMGRAIA